ncbi:hypothetical protein ACOME3_000197 [Neoechinorhynchus agilis]
MFDPSVPAKYLLKLEETIKQSLMDRKCNFSTSLFDRSRLSSDDDDDGEANEQLGDRLHQRLVPRISDLEYTRTERIFKDPTNSDEIVIQKFNIPIRKKDLKTLKPGGWLNDEIKQGECLSAMGFGEKRQIPSLYAFSTFFYPRLTSAGYDGVKRWTRRIDVFSYKLIIFPIHLPAHWTLAVADLTRKQLKYYDSLSDSETPDALNLIWKYLQREFIAKKGQEMETYQWIRYAAKCPRQENCDDCGVFLCQVAECVSRNVPIMFTGADIDQFCLC